MCWPLSLPGSILLPRWSPSTWFPNLLGKGRWVGLLFSELHWNDPKTGAGERVGGPDREDEAGGGAGKPGVQERAVTRLAASGSGLNGSREWSVCVCGHREW